MGNFLLEIKSCCWLWSGINLTVRVHEDPRVLNQLQVWSEDVQVFWGDSHLSQSQGYPSPNILCKPRLLLTGEFDLEKVRTVKTEEKEGQPVREIEDVTAYNLSFWYTHSLMYITAITEPIHFYDLQNSFNISQSYIKLSSTSNRKSLVLRVIW